MTAIVGMLCNDGVVIDADSSSTFSTGRERTIEQPSEKISIIGGSIIIAGTGQVGLDQRFTEVVSGVWSNKQFQQGTPMQIAKVLSANGINDFASTMDYLRGHTVPLWLILITRNPVYANLQYPIFNLK